MPAESLISLAIMSSKRFCGSSVPKPERERLTKRNQDAISDINEDDLFRLYRCNGVDVEILCMLQKLCEYHKIFLACIINKQV